LLVPALSYYWLMKLGKRAERVGELS
jgi:NCS1 family nucleobase:cation symporter-1